MIKKILQGILVGIGGILPGVSGGMIAASFNIYGLLMQAVNDLTRTPIKAIKSVWEYLVGATIGMILGFILIVLIFNQIPIPSTLFFIGLIIGGIPEIYFLAIKNKKNYKEWILVSIAFIFMVFVAFIKPNNDTIRDTNIVLWMIIGSLLALSIAIPGLSGTMILMILGYYIPLTQLPTQILNALGSSQFNEVLLLLIDSIFLGIGILATLIITSKLLSGVIANKPAVFYKLILGVIIASPINIIVSLRNELLKESSNLVDIFDFTSNWYMWLIGIAGLVLGVYLSRKFIRT